MPRSLSRRNDSPSAAGLSLHYCELCHAALRATETRLFALSMATSLLAASVASASLAVLREALFEAWPFWVGLALALLVLGLWLGARSEADNPSFEAKSDGTLWVWLPPGPGARALGQAIRATQTPEATRSVSAPGEGAMVAPRGRSGQHRRDWLPRGRTWIALAPAIATALPLLFALAFLRTRVLVLDENYDDVLLVDRRSHGTMPVMRDEWPGAGHWVRLLAGTRTLELVAPDGATRATLRTWLNPGALYAFGALPEGKCLFREEQEYGGEPAPAVYYEILGGPLYVLEGSFDHFFEPPPAGESATTRGGTVSALRLLPCRRTGSRPVEDPMR